jgi:hypothetical protein
VIFVSIVVVVWMKKQSYKFCSNSFVWRVSNVSIWWQGIVACECTPRPSMLTRSMLSLGTLLIHLDLGFPKKCGGFEVNSNVKMDQINQFWEILCFKAFLSNGMKGVCLYVVIPCCLFVTLLWFWVKCVNHKTTDGSCEPKFKANSFIIGVFGDIWMKIVLRCMDVVNYGWS